MATRRQALLTVGVGLGLAAQPAQAQSDAARLRPQEGDLLVRANSTDLTPLTADGLVLGGPQMLAVPYDPATKLVRNGARLNRILVLRLDPKVLNELTAQRRPTASWLTPRFARIPAAMW